MKKISKNFEFTFLILIFCFFILMHGCKSLVIKEDDSAGDKVGKIFGRTLLGLGTFGLSEGAIEDYQEKYKHEKQIGIVLRNYSIYTLQSLEDIGRAEIEIAFMMRQQQEEKIKYHMVMANNLLNRALDRMKKMKDINVMNDTAKNFKNTIDDIVNKKKQLIGYWLQKESGSAAAFQTLANQKIIEILDNILQLYISNKYVFSQDEISKIAELREKWARLTKAKYYYKPTPKQTF